MKKHPRTNDPEPHRAARGIIRFIDSLADWLLLVFVVVIVACGTFVLWDNHQVYTAASADALNTYKPDSEPAISFESLQKMNPDVFAWVNVYGTKIDYPVAQGKDNEKYLNTNAKGEFAISGCPFLDSENARDFSDVNSIIYGHHMDKRLMFGDLDKFRKKKFFKSRKYGDLYFGGKHHGLKFFAFIEGDAYDSEIYNPKTTDVQAFYAHLMATAKYKRNVAIDGNTHIVLLSTCASGLTNKRFILAAKLMDKPYKNPFAHKDVVKAAHWWERIPGWWWLLIAAAILLGASLYIVKKNKKKQSK